MREVASLKKSSISELGEGGKFKDCQVTCSGLSAVSKRFVLQNEGAGDEDFRLLEIRKELVLKVGLIIDQAEA